MMGYDQRASDLFELHVAIMGYFDSALGSFVNPWIPPVSGTPGEPFERFANFSLGHLGVDIFFVVSGFLVTGSLLARGSLGAFLRARSLRIFPALTANAFGSALVIGPLVTRLPLARYFASGQTWAYAFLNSTTWPWGVTWMLPGVFTGHPAGPAVNGALWSLPWGFRCTPRSR
jgi:peptidoglycan/LPS O-acetylase OafA/YrhL